MLPEHETTSQLLNRIANEALADQTDQEISLGEFIESMADRGFGVLILLCALPNFFPVNVPGISTIFSVILALLVMQWVLGLRLWLPHFIGKRQISEQKFANNLKLVTPKLEWMERYIKPRMGYLFTPVGRSVIGFALALQIAFLALPLSMIPFSNALPAYIIAAIAVGIVTKDGLFTLCSVVLGTIAIGLFSTVIFEVLIQIWQFVAERI